MNGKRLAPFTGLDPHKMGDLALLQKGYALAHLRLADDRAGARFVESTCPVEGRNKGFDIIAIDTLRVPSD